jgi:hypothetical protein
MTSFGLLSGVMVFAITVAQPYAYGLHPPRPGQPLYLYCQMELDNKTLEAEVPLEMSSSLVHHELDQVVQFAEAVPALHLKEFLPNAALKQRAVAHTGEDAGRAILVSIEGPTQSFQRWLVANDPARNRLVSFIATWRYMAVDTPGHRDDLLEQFKTELSREPTVLVERTDTGQSAELPAEAGTVWPLPELKCKVSVKTFLPDFSIDSKSGKPVRKTGKRVNPAALVRVEHEGKSEERWVFAKFPEFRSDAEQSLPFRFTLDCPLEKQSTAPDFLLLTVGEDAHEVCTRRDDKTVTTRISRGDEVKIAGSQYSFKIAGYLPSARLIEEYEPSEQHGHVSALRLEMKGENGQPVSYWLEISRQRSIPTEHGPMTVVFSPRRPKPVHDHP